MAKLICKFQPVGNITLKVHRLSQTDEWRVGHYDQDGKRIADSFHNDRADAMGTATFEYGRYVEAARQMA